MNIVSTWKLNYNINIKTTSRTVKLNLGVNEVVSRQPVKWIHEVSVDKKEKPNNPGVFTNENRHY